jgi:dienelactone hydrolase
MPRVAIDRQGCLEPAAKFRFKRWAAISGLLTGLFVAPAALVAAEGALPPANVSVPALPEGGVDLPAWFSKPEGAGPFPAVILLHGCHGLVPVVLRASLGWAAFLNQQGYAALTVDSFAPRGIHLNCSGPGDQSATVIGERTIDAYAAAYYLAGRADIKANSIGGIGFSNGAWVLLNVASEDPALEPLRQRLARRGRFAAFVPMYPSCKHFFRARFELPLLIQIGTGDDWTPSANCDWLVQQMPSGGPELRYRTYAGATHGFDEEAPARTVLGHAIRYDAEATAGSRREVADFFGQYLLGQPAANNASAAPHS